MFSFPGGASLPKEILGWVLAVVKCRRPARRFGRDRPWGGDAKSGPANYLVLGRPVEHTHPGAMVDIGLGPTHGFSFRNELLRSNHLVVSRLMPTIAPAC